MLDNIIPIENLDIAEITDALIEWYEIVTTLENMKNNKAASEDKIPVKLYEFSKMTMETVWWRKQCLEQYKMCMRLE